MKAAPQVKCPDCPDGSRWDAHGPDGKACATCNGNSFIDDDTAGPCEKCGDADTRFRSGSAAGMDVTCRQCDACDHQWDQT